MALKDNIKLQRGRLGLTLEELAQKVGVSRQTIQRYESGIISNIPSDNIEKIAVALETTPAYLMGWENDTCNPKPSTKSQTSSILLRAEKELSPVFFKQLENMAETLIKINNETKGN